MEIKRVTMATRWIFMLVIFGVCFLMGSPGMGQPPQKWKTGIAYDVVPGAEITKVSWYMGKTEVGEMLTYEVGIRNVSDKPKRFKLTIFPLEGDAIAGLYPWTKKKGKPLAVLEPKEELVLKFPVRASGMPKGFALVVGEVEPGE
ncbi:MAG: hypothetical protein HY882_09360 [Deltaproteobacteria bacterium]|nr:hypothetical protein [Deltaproteobacteria bacterium]